MNNMRLPLDVLDRYADMLTSKQVNKLYESKVGGTYKAKRLFEDLVEGKYMCFVPTASLTEIDVNPYDFMNYVQDGFAEDGDEHIPDVVFDTKNIQGMFISCKYPSSFMTVLHRLANLSLSKDVEQSVIPKSFVRELYPVDAEVDVI